MTCALDFTTPKEGEGGGGRLDHEGGIYMLAVSPFVTKFSKSIFWANKLPLPILIPAKPCWFCCVNLNVLQFVGSLTIIYHLKRREG